MSKEMAFDDVLFDPVVRWTLRSFLALLFARALFANAPLEDRDLAALLNWMLLRFSPAELPQPFIPYTEAEVAASRRAALPDPTARRAALLSLLEVRDAPPPP